MSACGRISGLTGSFFGNSGGGYIARALAEGVRGRLLLIALGPGFTAGFQLIEVE